MAGSTDFIPFATGAGANVISQASWVALAAAATGFSTGTAQSAQCNKAWRQSSFIAAGVATFVANTLSANIADDGNLGNFVTNLTDAIEAAALAVCGTVHSVGISSPLGTISVGGGPITNSGTLTVDLPAQGGLAAGTYINATVTVSARGVVTAISTGTAAQTSGASVAPNGVSDAVGTIASHGYDISPSGDVRIWAVIQCEDAGNGVYTPSTIGFAAILPGGVTLAKVSGIKSQNLGAWAGQGANSTRSTCIVMSLTTAQTVVTNQNSDNDGTLTSWYVEINGHT
jgi:hypothetical protein